MGFLDTLKEKKIDFNFDIFNSEIQQVRINLSTLHDVNRIHVDGRGSKTLLYYPNLKWEFEWGGHTVFLDDDLTDVEHCCVYKPGRLVLFDGSIPHTIFSPTTS